MTRQTEHGKKIYGHESALVRNANFELHRLLKEVRVKQRANKIEKKKWIIEVSSQIPNEKNRLKFWNTMNEPSRRRVTQCYIFIFFSSSSSSPSSVRLLRSLLVFFCSFNLYRKKNLIHWICRFFFTCLRVHAQKKNKKPPSQM